MGGHIALQLASVVGLEPAYQNVDEVKIDVRINYPAASSGVLKERELAIFV